MTLMAWQFGHVLEMFSMMIAAKQAAQAVAAAVLMNVAIVGINQVYDKKLDRVNKPYARQAPLQDECDHTLNTQDRISRSTTSGEIAAEAPSHLVTIAPHYLITPQGNSPILDVRGQRALYPWPATATLSSLKKMSVPARLLHQRTQPAPQG